MAYPTVYNVTYSYTGFQQSQGNNAFPGTQIDADLAGLQATIQSVDTFMQSVIRSDGALNNGVVTFDSLSASLQTAGIAPASAWATGTVYAVSNSVVTNGSLYRCLVAHTSGVFSTDLAAAKWLFVMKLGVVGPAISVAGNVPKFHDAIGSALDDSGVPLASLAPLASPALTGAPTATTLAINPPASSLNSGLNITQSSPAIGTSVGPLNYNTINIIHQTGTTGAQPQSAGLKLNMSVGGASLAGQPVIGGYFSMLETIPGAVSSADKIGAVGSSFLNQNDATSGFYGLNSVTSVANGGVAGRAVGFESDVDIRTGGLTSYRYAIAAVNLGAGQGSTLDAAYFVGNIGVAGGAFKNLFALSNSLGQAPLTTTANMFMSDTAATIGSVFNMSNVTVTGNILNFPNAVLTGAGALTAGSSVLSTSPLGGIGYAVGAGGAVAQATSKANGVTLNKVSGLITTNNAALAANAVASFILTNSAIAATDVVFAMVQSGNVTNGTYNVWAEKVSAGQAVICLQNISAGSLSEAISIQFVVIKGATS